MLIRLSLFKNDSLYHMWTVESTFNFYADLINIRFTFTIACTLYTQMYSRLVCGVTEKNMACEAQSFRFDEEFDRAGNNALMLAQAQDADHEM